MSSGSYEDRIREIEEEIRKTQYNKATERHIGLLKAKIARLKDLQETKGSKGARRKGIRKSGDATCALCGPPSVGKSTIFNLITSAESKVADYAFTTLDIIEGMMIYNGAHIQIFDTPGLIERAAEGRGMGREIISSLRVSELLIIIIDISRANEREKIEKELYNAGIRINKGRPLIDVKKRDKGGVEVRGTCDKDFVKSLSKEAGIMNASIYVSRNAKTEDIIDYFAGNTVYTKALWVLNKADEGEEMTGFDICVSAKNGRNIEKLKSMIFERLELIRVYTDGDEPMILKRGATVRDLAVRLHREFENRFRYAKVWGKSVKFPGQVVGLEHVLCDKDRIEIVLKV
jgi:hypothetical protein